MEKYYSTTDWPFNWASQNRTTYESVARGIQNLTNEFNNETQGSQNLTNGSYIITTPHHTEQHPGFKHLLKLCYVIGIIGNLAAIVALRRGERRMRNRKYLLMLTALAVNDLMALLGMMAMMVASEVLPAVQETQWFCALRVVMRTFGMGSVCITVTMALERWMALTQPFFYQKKVTYYAIRTALLSSWFWAAVLTCAPLAGLGLYYDGHQQKCTRYRNAVTSSDTIYAMLYVTVGTLLCVILVFCNLAVIRALYAISAPASSSRLIVRRISKNSSKHRGGSVARTNPGYNTATAEEVTFSRLMATLSVLFMICWLPQMVTSALYLASGPNSWARLRPLAGLSDLLMLLNYTLDPYLYVLMRRRMGVSSLVRCLSDCCSKGKCWSSNNSSTESIKTSCCPQETMLISDVGSELRPLSAGRLVPAEPGRDAQPTVAL